MNGIRDIDAILISLVFFVFGLTSITYSAEEQKDVGLITEITGSVSYSSADSKSGFSDAVVFMKVRSNDCLKIGEKSSLTLLYQGNGRREVWNGPLSIKIKEEESVVIEGTALGNSNKADNISVVVSDKVFMASELGESGKLGKSGIRVVRSMSETSETKLREGLEKYKKMKSDFGEKDAVPDLYLLSLYSELGKHSEMENQLKLMKQKWPGNPELKKWADQIKAK
ncbi:hypothetical protein [Desulforegula conservatrix]|uniref:hypothetical protein n=1 Tax=Desulforegula conservatrix TaxID=153026 RepID=UPI000426D8BA|nr:hypothetical protein [Desulforegula conservatrix]